MTNQRCLSSLLLAVVSALLVASCGKAGLDAGTPDAAPDSAPAQTCDYQGTKYDIGQSFKADCNTCTCSLSGVACTLMACGPFTGGTSGSTGGSGGSVGSGGAAGSSGSAGSGGAAGNGVGGKGGAVGSGGKGGSGTGGATVNLDAGSQGCLEGNHLYSAGETFMRDCNTCTCTATGASCTKMGCPADAGARTCSLGGKTYDIGETFKQDCNTCSCTSQGIACTAMACLQDAGPDLVSLVDAGSCTLSANLTFGRDGGMTIYSDVNRLTATTFTVTRNYNLRANPDGATSASCLPTFPACGSTAAVTIATINAELANPDVQSLWGLPQTTTPIFGSDPRPMDGTVYSIALDDGRKVLVGEQCASPTMSSCRYIPAGLVQLVQDLQKLATAGLADPACKAVF